MAWHFEILFAGGSWRWQNVKSRLIAIGAIVIGTLAVAIGAAMLIGPRTMFTPPPPARYEGLMPVGVGLLVMAVGLRSCRQVAFRPDLGDVHPMLGRAGGYTPEYVAEHKRAKRTWWTGDPMPREHRDHDA